MDNAQTQSDLNIDQRNTMNPQSTMQTGSMLDTGRFEPRETNNGDGQQDTYRGDVPVETDRGLLANHQETVEDITPRDSVKINLKPSQDIPPLKDSEVK